jgi:hypothetical protein
VALYDLLLSRSNVSGQPAVHVSAGQREAAKRTLAEIGCNYEQYGFRNTGEILEALAIERNELDPFAMICKFVGKMINWFGEWITLSVLIVGTVLTIQLIYKVGRSIGGWLYDVWGSFLGTSAPGVSAPGAPGVQTASAGGVGPKDGRQFDSTSDTSRLASIAMVFSFVPAPIAVLATAAVTALQGASPNASKDDLNS